LIHIALDFRKELRRIHSTSFADRAREVRSEIVGIATSMDRMATIHEAN
jgi:hypothetical protein